MTTYQGFVDVLVEDLLGLLIQNFTIAVWALVSAAISL